MKKFTALIAVAILALTVSTSVLAEPSDESDRTNETSVSSSVSVEEKENSADEKSKSESSADEQSKSESSVEEKSKSESSADEQSKSESSADEQSKSESSADEQSKSESSADEQSKSESSADEQSKSESSVQENSKVYYDSYPIPEAEMYISFPKDMLVITRNIESSSPILKNYKLSKDDLVKNFKETDTYLKASAEDFTYDITVNVLVNDDTQTIGDLSSLEDTEIQTIVNNMLKQPVYTGCSRTKYNNIPYLSFPMEYSSDKTTVKGMQEYTIVRGKRIVITFQSYTGEMDEHFNNLIAEVMNTVVFDGINPNSEVSVSESASVTNLDIRYVYLMIASGLAILFLMLVIVTAMKYHKSKKKALNHSVPEKTPEPVKEEPVPEKTSEPVKEESVPEKTPEPVKEEPVPEKTPEPVKEEPVPEEIPEPVEDEPIQEETVQEKPVPEPLDETLLPVVENPLEIVEIALRIIPALTPEPNDDTEIWHFIQKKINDMEFFAQHAAQNSGNANAFYRINANSNMLNTPNTQTIPKEEAPPPPTVDETIRTETLQNVVGDSKPETLAFDESSLSKQEEPDLNELIDSAPTVTSPTPQDVPIDDEPETDISPSSQEKISTMRPSEMKFGAPPKRPENEIYKADETPIIEQNIQLEISKSEDGKIKIGANNGKHSLDIDMKEINK